MSWNDFTTTAFAGMQFASPQPRRPEPEIYSFSALEELDDEELLFVVKRAKGARKFAPNHYPNVVRALRKRFAEYASTRREAKRQQIKVAVFKLLYGDNYSPELHVLISERV